MTGSTSTQVSTTTAVVHVLADDSTAIITPSDQSVAVGTSAVIDTSHLAAPTGSSVSGYWIQWGDQGPTDDGTFVSGLLPPSLSHTYAAPGIYDVSVDLDDDAGTDDYSGSTVRVTAPQITAPLYGGVPGGGDSRWVGVTLPGSSYAYDAGTVTFSSNPTPSTGATLTTYDVDFGDGTSLTNQHMGSLDVQPSLIETTHTYSAAGNYSAVLTVYDSSGGSSRSPLTVSVVGAPTITTTVDSGAHLPGQTARVTVSYTPAPGSVFDGANISAGIELPSSELDEVDVSAVSSPITLDVPLTGATTGQTVTIFGVANNDHGSSLEVDASFKVG